MAMGKTVSVCLRQDRVRYKGQLDAYGTPCGKQVVRVTLLPYKSLTDLKPDLSTVSGDGASLGRKPKP
jgi:hypothetical protein